MCGIVAAVAERNITPILLEGLRRLEYRGYDSAGIAVLDNKDSIQQRRAVGKIRQLEETLKSAPLDGSCGIGHTRWATHGAPCEENAHPHMSGQDIAIVHNGIIENHEQLRTELQQAGFTFTSETDSEVIAHLMSLEAGRCDNMVQALGRVVSRLEGAFAVAVLNRNAPDYLLAARKGSPLVIGVGLGENYLASDVAALLPVTRKFIFLEEGDLAELSVDAVKIMDSKGQRCDREIRESELSANAVERGEYRHYMLKEIYEQPAAIAETLEGRISQGRVLEQAFGVEAPAILDATRRIRIIACGTSFHAGMVARYWFESVAGMPCSVEVASEFRYRQPVVEEDTLVVAISQSGETADTISALKEAKRRGYSHSLAICNVAESSLVRESDLCLMTHAGPEIGVASTKAFTTQLVALLLLVIVAGRRHGLDEAAEKELVRQLESLPGKTSDVLALDEQISQIALQFADKQHALFLGRGIHYPVAMEGALKLKEISYIHAEAYPAGELKHGPLALVDSEMPVVAVAPNNDLLEKLKSNLREVSARGGKLLVFADESVDVETGEDIDRLDMAAVEEVIAPIIHTVPLQLLAYHVAVLKGTDVDQPRNLAKSVTVE